MSDDFNRSEQATAKHRQEARRRGQVARSTEISNSAAIFAGVVGLAWMGPHVGQGLTQFMHDSFTLVQHGASDLTARQVLSFHSVIVVASSTAMWIAVLYATALAVGFGQAGFEFADEALTPKWSNLSLINGVKKLVSWSSAVRTLSALFKLLVIVLACKGVVINAMHSDILNRPTSATELISYLMETALTLGWRVTAATGIIALADYGYQRWNHEKNLRMSKEEVKEESKQSEANPQMRARIRTLMRQRHRQRMMQEVARATVIITNPTHVAVALRYDRATMKAPRVVGKGLELMAAKIREIARANQIPMIENKPLARGLYRHCSVGKDIPASYYQAVAMVLAQVYRLAAQRGNPNSLPPTGPKKP